MPYRGGRIILHTFLDLDIFYKPGKYSGLDLPKGRELFTRILQTILKIQLLIKGSK